MGHQAVRLDARAGCVPDSVVCCPADDWGWVPEGSVDAIITSPPFERMRSYSDDPRDVGNYAGEEFVEHFAPVFAEWSRILRPSGNLFLNFMPQTAGGTLSSAAWLLPQAVAASGLHLVQELWVVKSNAMPIGDSRLLKPCVERVIHAVRDPAAFVVYKDAVRRPALWRGRDHRAWKYSVNGADGGNFISPALERLNRLAVKDILALVCPEDANTLVIAKTQTQSTVHPAVMSAEVARWLLAYGSAPGDTLADPFLGSGTTLVEAKALGRHYLGGDLNAAYVEQARQALDATEFGSALVGGIPTARPRPPIQKQVPAQRPSANCRRCSTSFEIKKAWQEFCSAKCRYAWHNERGRSDGKEADVDRGGRVADG